MKKIMFTACAAVVSVAVFTACGNGSSSASKVSEEKVNGTAYAITRTTNETGTVVFGVKNGEEQVIPNDYASMSYTHGYFLAGYDKMMAGVNLKGAALLDPQNGEEVITSDSISFNEEGGYFIGKGKQSGIALFYPENKVGFYALRDYVISGNIVDSRDANIVFPAPGGPIISIACPPAAAISSARFAALWPRTSDISICDASFVSKAVVAGTGKIWVPLK